MLKFKETSEAYLVESSPIFAGPVFNFFFKPQVHIKDAWELDKQNSMNYTLSNEWVDNTVNDEMAKGMADYFKAFCMSYAVALARKVNFKELFGVETFLDIAGGTGTYRYSK